MTTRFRAALALIVSVFVFAGPVSAATNATSPIVAQTAQSGNITGHVTNDTGSGIAGAQVVIDGAGVHQTAATDDSGNFSAAVPAGLYTVSVTKGGYQTGSSDVTVTEGAPVDVGVQLGAATLSNLGVIGRTTSTGGSARFNVSSSPQQTISQDQILQRNTPDLTSVLQELPGVTIPRATSNPNQSFIVRGMRFETKTTLDGHPVSSGTLGSFLTNYMSAGIFSGVDVVKGPAPSGALGAESPVGTVNLHTPGFGPNGAYVMGGGDNYNGTFYDAIVKFNMLPNDKLSFVFGRSFTGYRGPTYGTNQLNFTGGQPAFGTFSPPGNLTNDIVTYFTDFSDTYSLNSELAKMRYEFSDATSLSFEYLGLQGRFDPQGGAYGQFLGYGTIPQCLNGTTGGTGAACTILSTYNTPAAGALGVIGAGNTPLYAFFPGSDVRQNAPNFNAEFKTTIGNDTILFRPYTAAINRLIDGTQENTVPGDAGGWFQVTSAANCQVQFVAPKAGAGGAPNTPASGPCFAANQFPVAAYVNDPTTPHVFNATGSALTCSVAAPCYTTSTAQNNAGQFGYGAPFTTLEIDKLFGYTFSWIHPVGNNTYSLTLDHYLDDATDLINDASPLAAGCSFVLGSGQANNIANSNPASPTYDGSQATCPLTALRPSPISVPETASSVTSLSANAQFQLTSKLELDFSGYFTHYLINAQQESPALLAALTPQLGPLGRTGSIPVVLSPIQNTASHFDPQFGLIYRANRDLAFRFGAGSGLSIPYASLVSGFTTYAQGSTSTTVTSPNASLLPEEIVSMDLGADWRTPDGTVLSADIYNIVVHNPWLSPKVLICPGTPQCAGGGTAGNIAGLEPSLQTFSSQTVNGAQQYAQGIEFSIAHEPLLGFGYRVNTAFSRNYYLDTPASFFVAPQVFFNGNQYVSTGSGNTSVPYSKAYSEIQYGLRGNGLIRFGADYEGSNNEYNAPAFFIFDAGARFNTGFHDVMLGAAVENLTNMNFGAQLGRGVEFQGLTPVTATTAPGGYTYGRGTFNTALVSPGPITYRMYLSKKF